MERIKTLWNDVHKELAAASALARREKIVNWTVSAIYFLLCIAYAGCTYYGLFSEANAAPGWLPFGGLYALTKDIPFADLILGVSLAALSLVLGFLVKGLVRAFVPVKPSNLPPMPEDRSVMRNKFSNVTLKIDELRERLWDQSDSRVVFCIASAIVTVALGIYFGIVTQNWKDAVISILFTAAVIIASYALLAYLCFEKNWSRINEIYGRVCAPQAEGNVLFILELIREGNYAEALKIAELYKEESNCKLFAMMLNGLEQPLSAAKAISEIGMMTYRKDYRPEINEAIELLKPKLSEMAKVHYEESEKEADAYIAAGNLKAAQKALSYSRYTSGDRRLKYVYTQLKDANASLTRKEVEDCSWNLDQADYAGISPHLNGMYRECRNELAAWASAYAVVLSRKNQRSGSSSDSGADWNGMPHQVDYNNVKDM